jgi:hypothetical protein
MAERQAPLVRARQGNTASLAVGQAPISAPRQLILSQKMDVVDGARLVPSRHRPDRRLCRGVRCKYHYELWRPITAIRNSGVEANSATPRDATWQPIDNTPMHPEYPCAHCINAGVLQR